VAADQTGVTDEAGVASGKYGGGNSALYSIAMIMLILILIDHSLQLNYLSFTRCTSVLFLLLLTGMMYKATGMIR
jgi:hypothetical protein